MSGLRLFFFLLILANAIFFAWTEGYLGGSDAGREPQRLARQIAPDSLRVVVAGETAAKPQCRMLTGLAPDAAEGLKSALNAPGITIDIKPGEEAPRFRVHIPPLPNQAAAEKKAGELRKLGVNDFQVELDEGPNRYALTFGVYKSEAAAEEFLQALAKRGVRSARIVSAQGPTQAATVLVRGPAEILNKRLPEMLARLPDAKAVDCP